MPKFMPILKHFKRIWYNKICIYKITEFDVWNGRSATHWRRTPTMRHRTPVIWQRRRPRRLCCDPNPRRASKAPTGRRAAPPAAWNGSSWSTERATTSPPAPTSTGATRSPAKSSTSGHRGATGRPAADPAPQVSPPDIERVNANSQGSLSLMITNSWIVICVWWSTRWYAIKRIDSFRYLRILIKDPHQRHKRCRRMEMIVTVFLSGLLWDRGSDRVTSSAWGNPPSIYCATSRVVQSKNHQLMTLGSSSVPPTTTGPSMAIMLPRGLQINQVPPPLYSVQIYYKLIPKGSRGWGNMPTFLSRFFVNKFHLSLFLSFYFHAIFHHDTSLKSQNGTDRKLTASNPCELSCRAQDRRGLVYTFGKVEDGTRCSIDGDRLLHDFCINGRCLVNSTKLERMECESSVDLVANWWVHWDNNKRNELQINYDWH